MGIPALLRSGRALDARRSGFAYTLVRRYGADVPSGTYAPSEPCEEVTLCRHRGLDLLHTPVYNKGTSFTPLERERLGLRGLLPPVSLSVKNQLARLYESYWHGSDFIDPSELHDGGVTHEHTRRWTLLTELQDRNETLFYRMLVDNFAEMAPIVYTPTVGWACMNYHKLYRRPRGMFFSALDVGSMATMVHNWPNERVDAIVVTDGSRILGLGDLGCNGLGIPVGKLDLYVAGGGFHPSRVLPCVIDVGTANRRLLDDPVYFGIKAPRLQGDAYYRVVDEFVRAVMSRWPKAVLQFEDFDNAHAAVLLERYRHHHTVFNDDIQGTAAAALAGLYGALRVKGKAPKDLVHETFTVAGAGSAGLGVISAIARALVKHGLSPEEARARFHVVDNIGLVTAQRADLSPDVRPFARTEPDAPDGLSLAETVARRPPSVLIGLTGAGRLFTDEILRSVAAAHDRPIVFPMSNPTIRLECTHEAALEATGGRVIYASGSPQPKVEFGGVTREASQANNMYVFPGLALGAFLARGGIVTDEMLMAAAEAVPEALTEDEITAGLVYPHMGGIRDISRRVAKAVLESAFEDGHVKNPAVRAAIAHDEGELDVYIRNQMYEPDYSRLVFSSQGSL